MAKVKKGRKGKNPKKSKQETKVKVRAKGKKEVQQKSPVKVKLEPDECTFTHRDAEKEAEADRNASGHKVMSVSEYVRSIRPEYVPDVKPKIESIVKQEPSDPDQDPEFVVVKLENDEVVNDEILNNPPKEEQLNKKSLKCPVCLKICRDRTALMGHGYVHREKTSKCDICEKSFARKSQLNRHKIIHSPNKRYSCDICKKEYTRKDSLKEHQKIHNSSGKLFECRICEKKFISANYLKSHIKQKHGKKEKKKCIFCDRKFVNKNSHITHMRSEHFSLLRQQDKSTGDLHPIFLGRRTYECYRCKFPGSKINVKEHMQTCRGERKVVMQTVKCELCIGRFTSRSNLKRHMKNIHSIHLSLESMRNIQVEKIHKCTFCDKSFYLRLQQISHIRTEHFSLLRQQDRSTGDLHPMFQGIRTYECYRCKFPGPIPTVKKHIRTCNGEGRDAIQTINCEFCSRRFCKKESLRNHICKRCIP